MPSDIAIKVRRGTGTQWIAANTILAAGELGLNTDINRLKIGNGTLGWNSLSYINIAPTDVNEATQDYIGAFLQNGTHDGVNVTYNDTLNTIAISANRDVVVDKTTVQTLTNKTLTSPVINTPTGITKSDVGLGSVDNTTDAAKPISTATQTALDLKLASTTAASTYATITNNNLKAPIESPTFTGTVTLPGAPSSDLHAATKAYVDAVSAGLKFNQPVRATSASNVTLSGIQTIDDVVLVAGDRFLARSQTTATQNGIYVVSSGAWTRATDADNNPTGEIAGGDFVFVLEGTFYAGYGYVCSNTSAVTIGTTNITYVPFNASKAVATGYGLSELTPGVLSINLEDTIDINTAQILQNKRILYPTIRAAGPTTTVNVLNDLSGTIESVEFNTMTFKIKSVSYIGAKLIPGYLGGDTLSSITISSGPYAGTYPVSSYYFIAGTSGSGGYIYYNTDTPQHWAGNTTSYVAISNDLVNFNVATAVTIHSSEIGYLDGVTSTIQTQLDGKVDESIITAKGDLYVGSASSTLDNLAVGTNGYLLTADSSETLGVKWAAAPVSLPTQTGQQGKYLTTNGSSASWAVVDLTPVDNNLIMQIMEAY